MTKTNKKLGTYAFLNGKIIPSAKATIHCFDLGLMRGLAVFDFFRFSNYKAHFIKDNIDRFFNSAKTFGIPPVFTKEQYIQIVNELIQKNKQERGSVRIILSAGPVTDGFVITKPQIIILIEPYYELPAECFEKGVKIITLPYKRPFAEAKHTHYAVAGMNDAKKKKQGALEILYVDEKGFVTEPSTSNICMIKKGVLYTPKSNVLSGITLRYILKCARKLGLKTIVKDFKLQELVKADEVFITATNKDALPIVKIDSYTISDGKPGTLTAKILECYRALINETN